jgi:hypothetical protein
MAIEEPWLSSTLSGCTPQHFLTGHILDMRGDPPVVARRVLNAAGAVSVKLIPWLSE